MTPEELGQALLKHAKNTFNPDNIPGAGQAGGTFVDFIHDAAYDFPSAALSMTYREAELWANYIAGKYVLVPREALE